MMEIQFGEGPAKFGGFAERNSGCTRREQFCTLGRPQGGRKNIGKLCSPRRSPLPHQEL